jgi:AcrR family transcriptional regulator
MGQIVSTQAGRRHVRSHQADKVDRLVTAALDEVRGTGYDGLTVRNVAKRAGVAPATAYTYFASKDHLVAEVFWRRLEALPEPKVDARRSAAARATGALREIALVVAEEPELAAAATTAVMANDPDVHRLRARMGAVILHRLAAALGDDAHPGALQALGLAFSGGMLQAGMGYFDYAELADRMGEVAAVVLAPRR